MLDRYELKVVEAPIVGDVYPISVNQLIAITNDGGGIAECLAAKFVAKGYQAVVVEKIPAVADVVVLLDGLRAFVDEVAAVAVNRGAFLAVQAIAERLSLKGGLFVTVQDTGGSFALESANAREVWSAGLAGLVKTAAQEWSKACCRAIDLQRAQLSADTLAERLLQEILTGSCELECGWLANGRRITLRTVKKSVKRETLCVDKHAVILVSGGARGVTAACLIALAKQIKARFVLLGRTEIIDESDFSQQYFTEMELRKALLADTQAKNITPDLKQINQQVSQLLANREIKAVRQALADAGSETLYFNLDVQNQTQLDHVLAQVRKQWGNITGLIHGAGVLADKLITQKTAEQFDRVFNTKVLGLRNLLHATQQDPLSFITLFSSVAARYGNQGQVDYAMANEVLNKVAQYEQQRRGAKCLVKSINWGPWEGGMVTPELKNLFKQRGIAVLPIAQGTQMFIEELTTSADTGVEVVCGSTLQTSATTCTFSVDINSHPFLTSHVIKNQPVLPAALALEWFVRTVNELYPQMRVVSCTDFKVLSGIRLTDFYTAPQHLTTQCKVVETTANKQTLLVELTDTKEKIYYRATLLLQTGDEKNLPVQSKLTLQHKEPWPWQVKDVYVNKNAPPILFHGPDFQAIHSLDTLSSKGGAGQIVGLHKLTWPEDNWQLDVAALDGVLQLLYLWGFHHLKQKSLPTQVAAFTYYDIVLPTGILHCEFNSVIKDQYRTVSDAVLRKENGDLYAEFHGIEMCVARI